MLLIRASRGSEGRARSLDDLDHNDRLDDLAGDFNAEGVADVGGPESPYNITGGSLGDILAMTLGSADANVWAAAPISGGGRLTDIGIGSTQGGAKKAVILRVMGPIVVALPATSLPPGDGRPRTSCCADQASLRFIVPVVNETGELEVACVDRAALAPGDDVVLANVRSGASRCARASTDGRFRIETPSNLDDRLELRVVRGAAVTCRLWWRRALSRRRREAVGQSDERRRG